MTTGGENDVTVQFVGPVRRPAASRGATTTVSLPATRSLPGVATVGWLLTELGYAAHEQARLQVLVDGAPARGATPLSGGATVQVVLLVGGG